MLADRIRETTTTTGTGAISLAGAVAGYKTFSSAFGTTGQCYYCIAGPSEWEIGIGTMTSSSSLSRTSVIGSSNANGLVNLSSGTKDVFCSIPASIIPMKGASASFSLIEATANLPYEADLNAVSGNKFFGVNALTLNIPASGDGVGIQLVTAGQTTQIVSMGSGSTAGGLWVRVDDGAGFQAWDQTALRNMPNTIGKTTIYSDSSPMVTYLFTGASTDHGIVQSTAGGTEASPSATTAGTRLWSALVRGCASVSGSTPAYHTNYSGCIELVAAEDGASGNGVFFRVLLSDKGGDSGRVERFRITEDGLPMAYQLAPVDRSTTTTLTVADLAAQIVTAMPTADITLTLPTGTLTDAAFVSPTSRMSFDWSVINKAAATYKATIAAGTGHSVIGNMDVAAKSSGMFRTVRTAANTYETYRIA